MQVKLTKLALVNFKGIRNFVAEFSQNTVISGQNGTGKSTIFDAFLWLLFGKNASDKKDFNIKNTSNTDLNRQDHEVTGWLDVNGMTIELKRVYREKWVKKRGSEESEYAGNETLYFANEVPLKQSEFQAKIDSIIKEELFRLTTNPLYFNSLKWEQRRNVLLSLVGGITDKEILDKMATSSNENQMILITNLLESGKSFEEFKRQTASAKKRLKDQLESIPHRIDEASRTLKDPAEFEGLESEVENKTKSIQSIENKLNSLSGLETEKESKRARLVQELTRKVNEASQKVKDFAYNFSEKSKSETRNLELRKSNLTIEISGITSQVSRNLETLNNLSKQIEANELSVQKTREEFKTVNNTTIQFDEQDFICPTCLRPHEGDNREEIEQKLIENFNEDKAKQLSKIREKGHSGNALTDSLKKQLDELNTSTQVLNENEISLKNERTGIEEKIKALESNQTPLGEDPEYIALTLNHSLAEQEKTTKINEFDLANADNNNDAETKEGLLDAKIELQSGLDLLKSKLTLKSTQTLTEARIIELKAEEKSFSQQLAYLEKEEFAINEFNKQKVNLLEEKINGRFKYARFKLFEQQINGGEVECCETYLDGVPWSDANTAAKVNYGIDIINTLCEYYNVSAPIFIDNRESTNWLIESNSQIINLFVDANAKNLTIHHEA